LLDWDARTHYDVASAQLQVWAPGVPGYRWKPNAVLDGRPFTNNIGFPMEHDVAPTPVPGVQRLIAIGASTTQGYPPEAAYPRQLQMLLDAREPSRWEVVNAGHQGYTIEATLALLRQRVIGLHPDVLVYYGEINDLIVRQRLADPRATDNGGLEFLRQHSAFWHFYLAPIVDPLLGMGTDTVDWPAILERWGWERSLELILDTAHDAGVRVVLATYAYGPQADQPLTGQMRLMADVGWPSLRDPVREYREGVSAENAIVSRIAIERGVPIVDVSARLDGHLEHFEDLVHLTPSGYGVLAESIAEALPAAAVPRIENESRPVPSYLAIE
jgi:lysophospholipase L1-like esterase